PDYALVTGNPAKIKGWVCQCGVKLITGEKSEQNKEYKCSECGKVYKTDQCSDLIELAKTGMNSYKRLIFSINFL
ncbi:MAG: hypothetical protein M0P94_05475, partial [Candidatus Absconditabacterales bacterium]|nr:hypothetical protein [Candidatus Absconditabacterales bacterium]